MSDIITFQTSMITFQTQSIYNLNPYIQKFVYNLNILIVMLVFYSLSKFEL